MPRARPINAAGAFEVWAARAWNVFNEGKPFSIVYPAMVLAAAAPLGLGPAGGLGLALLGAVGLAAVLSRSSFPLRGRALLWLAAAASVPLLEPWRAPALLLGALGGYVFFTVLFWGTLYYRLRTGAAWTNFSRFWRLVLTNSDPTSGNALEQVPKLMMALSAGVLLAEDPGGGERRAHRGRGRDRRDARCGGLAPVRARPAARLSAAPGIHRRPVIRSRGGCT